MVPNTSDDLPDPETPVNTVSRRFGISTLMSLRLFSRAPWTRMRSCASAACCLEDGMGAIMSPRGARLGQLPSVAGWIAEARVDAAEPRDRLLRELDAARLHPIVRRPDVVDLEDERGHRALRHR